jgi:SNF2 family DNA or RNA helicase
MNVVVYTGNQESREIIRALEFYYKSSKSCTCKFNVLITSYDTAINDDTELRKIKWEVLVVDEAHRLKNADSKFFKVSSMLDTRHKVLLTGTPL